VNNLQFKKFAAIAHIMYKLPDLAETAESAMPEQPRGTCKRSDNAWKFFICTLAVGVRFIAGLQPIGACCAH
jgi:hypothetical protein